MIVLGALLSNSHLMQRFHYRRLVTGTMTRITIRLTSTLSGYPEFRETSLQIQDKYRSPKIINS